MRNLKSILAAGVALAVICAAVVAALALTNRLTKDTIDEQLRAATADACKTVMADADHFESMDGAWQEGVLEVYEAKKGQATVGYVVKTETAGKSAGLVVMTGVTLDGTVSGVSVVDDAETAGYVDKVVDGGLLTRLESVSAVDGVDGVSQATKTSNGIKNGVTLALETVREVMAGE